MNYIVHFTFQFKSVIILFPYSMRDCEIEMPVSLVVWKHAPTILVVAIHNRDVNEGAVMTPEEQEAGLCWGKNEDRMAVKDAVRAVAGVDLAHFIFTRPSLLLVYTLVPVDIDSELVASILSVIQRYVVALVYYSAEYLNTGPQRGNITIGSTIQI